MKSLLLILPILIGLSGCVSPVASNVQSFDLDKLRAIELVDICKDYYRYNRDNKRAEGKSGFQMSVENTGLYHLASDQAVFELETVMIEKGITEEELESIRQNRVFIGMSKAAVYASWGTPYRENITILAGSVSVQMVFGSRSRRYVYTENGVVTGIQN